MKVLQVIPSLASRTGGPAAGVVESSIALRAHGVASHVFATDMAAPARNGVSRPVTADDLPIGAASLDLRLFPARGLPRFAYSAELGRALRETAATYDLIHVHSLFLYPQLAAYRAGHRMSVPFVVSPRGALDRYLRRRGRGRKWIADRLWQSRMLDEAGALHLTSEREREETADIAPKTPRYVIPNGIRWDDFQAPTGGHIFRSTYLEGFDGPVVGVHGRLSFKKGLDILIRAFAIARRELGDGVLVIAGPDDEQLTDPLRLVAESVGVEHHVRFTGMLGPTERLRALAAIDVWALPSFTENFGNAAAEALAAGRAVVSTSEVAVARDAAAEGAAIAVEADPSAFAHAIVGVLSDPDRRRRLEAAAPGFARRYSWQTVAERLAQMYRQVSR